MGHEGGKLVAVAARHASWFRVLSGVRVSRRDLSLLARRRSVLARRHSLLARKRRLLVRTRSLVARCECVRRRLLLTSWRLCQSRSQQSLDERDDEADRGTRAKG